MNFLPSFIVFCVSWTVLSVLFSNCVRCCSSFSFRHTQIYMDESHSSTDLWSEFKISFTSVHDQCGIIIFITFVSESLLCHRLFLLLFLHFTFFCFVFVLFSVTVSQRFFYFSFSVSTLYWCLPKVFDFFSLTLVLFYLLFLCFVHIYMCVCSFSFKLYIDRFSFSVWVSIFVTSDT